MKRTLTILATLFCSSVAFSQDIIVQDSAAWEAKYYSTTEGGEAPSGDWYEESFSDADWETVSGPIWRSAWPYYSTFWLRRHFVVDGLSSVHDGDFRYLYDCEGVVYLNGTKVTELTGSYGSWHTVSLPPSVLEAIHEGDNVLAVRAYDNGGDAFINFGLQLWKEPRKYAELHVAVDSLQLCLQGDVSNALPLTVAEATNLLDRVKTAMENYEYSNTDAEEMTRIVNSMVDRLAYQHLTVNVDVPGAMGDSILSKVENFSDVLSLKLSGTLNDADISTIQSRLMNLREIDMTDVKMEMLPNHLFHQHHSLLKVFLPKSLKSIGEAAFYQCYGINYIEFPSSLTTINRYSFSECDNLQEVILPEGFNSLGEQAFYSCDNNKYVKLPSTLTSINSFAFYYNLNLRNIDFAEGLTHIYNGAFYECRTLNNLKFPSTLYYIGNDAFAYNSSLSSIAFNEGLYQIADNAFYDCDALTEVTLPSSLVLANASPFDYCDNLRKVTCLSIEPPYMTDQIPYGLSMEGRELYVPALSINVYKQTTGWDRFPTINPIDYLPENIAVRTELHLTLPENIPSDYKPNVDLLHAVEPQYGCLTVNGLGTLSMSSFRMYYDHNLQYNYYDRNLNYCSLVNNSHLRADRVTIDIVPRNDRWIFLTLPFDVKMSDIEAYGDGTTNWVVRKYDGQKRANGETADTWVKLDSNDVLNAGEGYILQSSRYIGNNWQDASLFHMNAVNNTNKNNIFRTTDVIVTLNEYESEFAHNRSWNLIGNPYPCYYDTRFMDFEAPITVWNMRSSTYEAYSPSDDSYILCPGEAFFVQRPVANGNIVFSKDGRQTNRDVRALESNARANIVSRNTATRTIINLLYNIFSSLRYREPEVQSVERSLSQCYLPL